MSKISEQKALEEYPLPIEESEIDSFINQETFNSAKRTGYVKGYDQAMQDFLGKACEYLAPINYTHPHLIDLDDFKNYMKGK